MGMTASRGKSLVIKIVAQESFGSALCKPLSSKKTIATSIATKQKST